MRPGLVTLAAGFYNRPNARRRCQITVEAEHARRAPAGRLPAAIAIDGPVASGKTAVGARVARRLAYRFVDTGMMYRAATWLVLQRGVDLDDEAAVGSLIANAGIALEFSSADPEQARVLVDGTDVTGNLRSTEIGSGVSLISRVPGVRNALVEIQRALAAEGRIVMAGRDIGTVVLPDAPLKVYLDASPQERVRRRLEELRQLGRDIAEADVRAELALRDKIDSAREMSPLRPADDAVVIPTDGLTLVQVVARVLELARCG
jgi:cytidylate kinase